MCSEVTPPESGDKRCWNICRLKPERCLHLCVTAERATRSSAWPPPPDKRILDTRLLLLQWIKHAERVRWGWHRPDKATEQSSQGGGGEQSYLCVCRPDRPATNYLYRCLHLRQLTPPTHAVYPICWVCFWFLARNPPCQSDSQLCALTDLCTPIRRWAPPPHWRNQTLLHNNQSSGSRGVCCSFPHLFLKGKNILNILWGHGGAAGNITIQ